MTGFLNWLCQHTQIDLGNLAVGLGTVIVAFVTLKVSVSNIEMEANHRIGSFRVDWIENLRRNVSKFIGIAHKIINESISTKEEDLSSSILDELVAEMNELEAYINLMLNINEESHINLSKSIGKVCEKLNYYSVHYETETIQLADPDLKSISDITRSILKSEWDRASSEIKRQK
ncbi:MAG TPA: hypothetical protein PLK13_16515 [Xanthobacteraceae bacterium]|jgi:methyl coenzyme M reductase subunit C-like uncharacterized protein (methanogenesis marker protein 7)|uniref:hypothetical protein n=1 Tax=Roseixanthobacter finlandensis TaxID=3119922 RepID=UPI002BDCE280|nr:hypothetical protein [Xanthobacteraceae bacterium]